MIVTDKDRIGPWVCERTGGRYEPTCSTAIGWERDGQLTAGVLYDQYNTRSICMHVASDGTKEWMRREYLAAAFHYPFSHLGVNKILGLVDSTNQLALDFDESLGFRVEHVISGAGKYGDLVVLSMTKDECRWLKLAGRYQWH